MAVTIKDVALLAGVAPSTVSRTCSDHPAISPKTKEKVRRAMADLGYEPNFSASNLAVRLSHTIGIILPDSKAEIYENPFFLSAIRGVCQYCNNQQYMVSLVTGEDEKELLECLSTMIKSRRADGYIMMYSKWQDKVLDYLNEQQIIYAVIGKSYHDANTTIYVDNDNVLIGREATEYLIQLGHKRIAYLGGADNQIVTLERLKGYLTALEEHGIISNPDYCLSIPQIAPDLSSQFPAIKKLFTVSPPPTAVVVSDDVLAVALEKSLRKLHIAVPEEVSILSFNNSFFAQLANPQLTSVDINIRELGTEAAYRLIEHIEHPEKLATKTIVPHYIVERDSCKSLLK